MSRETEGGKRSRCGAAEGQKDLPVRLAACLTDLKSELKVRKQKEERGQDVVLRIPNAKKRIYKITFGRKIFPTIKTYFQW